MPRLAVTLLLLLCASWTIAAEKPNIVFFLVDDMGWVDCGAYGSKYYQTPTIDRFATQAMRFTDAYAQPLCSPTRGSLLSGKYSARHGITSATGHQPPQAPGYKFLPDSAPPNQPTLTPESKNYLEPSEITLAETLHAAGYRTAHIGKWHLGLTEQYWPEKQGFDVAFHCHPDPGPPGFYFSPYGLKPAGDPRGQQRVGRLPCRPRHLIAKSARGVRAARAGYHCPNVSPVFFKYASSSGVLSRPRILFRCGKRPNCRMRSR